MCKRTHEFKTHVNVGGKHPLAIEGIDTSTQVRMWPPSVERHQLQAASPAWMRPPGSTSYLEEAGAPHLTPWEC